MNLRQKKFITEKLIPFILREKGQGFIMEGTIRTLTPGEEFSADGIRHKTPSCGAAACVLGSIRMLRKRYDLDYTEAAKILGISSEAAYGLFYSWYETRDRYRWPKEHAEAFALAETPLAKAKVAVRLLREVVKTNGACLDTEATNA